MADAAAVRQITGYHFRDTNLVEKALTAAGVGVHSNKRLALVGDALIRLIVVDCWYPTGTSTADGQRDFAKIGTNDVLYQRGCEQGLADVMIKNPCHGESVPKTTLASSMEAIIGAVWIDSGRSLHEVRMVMERLDVLRH